MAKETDPSDEEGTVADDGPGATQPDDDVRPKAVVENAVGIVMSPGGRSPREAFDILNRVSQREHRDVDDVATELVELTEQRTPPSLRRPTPADG